MDYIEIRQAAYPVTHQTVGGVGIVRMLDMTEQTPRAKARRRQSAATKQRPTISDVAREAGVSTASVSRVLNDVPPLSPQLVRTVQSAAERLGYHTNEIARALRVQRTLTVGLVVPNLANPFFPQLVQELEIQLRAKGHGLLLADSLDDARLEADRIEELLDRQVEGLIVSPCDIELSRDALERAATRAPIIQLDRRTSQRLPFVGMDHDDAMRQALGHLHAVGRHTIAYIGSALDNYPAVRRHQAFLEQTDTATRARVLLGDFSFEWGLDAAETVRRLWPEVDAIVCVNDLVAFGAVHRLTSLGTRVPEQIAVTGFDDTMVTRYARPSITTVRQPLASMAAEAIAQLDVPEDLRGDIELPGVLVVRDSTPTAPAAGPSC